MSIFPNVLPISEIFRAVKAILSHFHLKAISNVTQQTQNKIVL